MAEVRTKSSKIPKKCPDTKAWISGAYRTAYYRDFRGSYTGMFDMTALLEATLQGTASKRG